MIKILKNIFYAPKDTTDKEVDKLRREVLIKTNEVQKVREKFEKTTTYYIAKAAGVLE